MPILDETYLTFDDLTILPGRGGLSLEDIDPAGRVSRRCRLPAPLLSAAMPTITEAPMAIAMGLFGGMGVIHRFMPIDDQARAVAEVAGTRPDRSVFPGASVGEDGHLLCGASLAPSELERAKRLAEAGARVLFLDTAQPVHDEVFAAAEEVRRAVSVDLVIGSVVDGETAARYIEMGIDGIKVGLGSGALCTMRRATGVGVPQVTALQRVVEVASAHGVPVISDGGTRCSGDIVKALAVGASAVMIGSLLSGCEETPAAISEVDGKKMKRIEGLTISDLEIEAPTGYPAVDAYLREEEAPRVEGATMRVPYTGPCHLTLLRLVCGVRGGMQMIGAPDLASLRERARMVRVSAAGMAEAYARGGS